MTRTLMKAGLSVLLVLATIATLAPLASAAGDGGVIGTTCVGNDVRSGNQYTSYCDGAHYTDGTLDCLGRYYDNGTCTT